MSMDRSSVYEAKRACGEAARILYYEAVAAHNDGLKKESKKILRNRLRSKALSSDLAAAALLLDRCDEGGMLLLIEEIENPILRCRALAPAFFSIATKRLEQGDRRGYSEALEQMMLLYGRSHAVTLEIEYYLADILLQEGRHGA